MTNHFLRYILLITLAIMPVLSAQEEQAPVRPGTINLSAYQTVKEAQKLEESKQYKEAWDKYQQALRYYASLAAAHPEWHPGVVERRIKTTTEAITRVEPMAQKAFMLEQAKLKDFVGQDSTLSENPTAQRHSISSADLQQLTLLNNRINSQQNELRLLKRKHKTEKQTLEQKVTSLQKNLRKLQQGLGAESSESKMLTRQIAELQRKLRKSQQLGKNDQQLLQETIEKLQHTRTALATAPLRQDVEKLQKKNEQQELELIQLANAQNRVKKTLKEKTTTLAKVQNDLKLTQGLLDQKTQQLEASQTNTKKVVTAMRKEIKQLKSQLSTAQARIAEQNTEIADLVSRLAESESVSDQLRSDLADMTAERDKISEMLQFSDADRAKELMKENLRLGKELSQAIRNLKQLSADKNAAQDRVIAAESVVAYAKQQIINLREDNTKFRVRITNLEKTLKSTQEELAQASSKSPMDPAAREEADILKKTVARLMTQSQRRREAERLLWKEYQKSAQNNPEFEQKYSALSGMDVKLTAKEKSMLRSQGPDGELHSPHSRADRHSREKAKAKVDAQIAAYHSSASHFIKKENYKSAKELYDLGYDTIPDYSLLINRGVIRMRLDELAEAEEIFELGTSQRPRSPYTHYLLGLARFELGKDDLAAKSLDRTLDLQPDNKDAMLYRGIIEAENGRQQKALEYYEKAIDLDPEYHTAHFNLAALHHMMGNNKKARESYNNALRSGLAPNIKFEKTIGINKAG